MQYLLGLGLLLVSFFQNFSTVPWRAAHSELYAFLAAMLCCWSAMRGRGMRFTLTPPAIALLCLVVLIGFQYVAGQIFFGGDAITLLLYVQLCLGALWVGQLHAEDADWPKALALALLLAAVGSSLIALAQALWVWTDSGWILSPSGYRRPGANMGQPNQLATLLLMGAASLIYLDQRLKIGRPILLLLSSLLLLGLGIAESRTGLLSGVALSLWWFGRSRGFASIPRWPWIAGSVMLLITFMWLWPHLITTYHEAGSSANGGSNTGVGLNTAVGGRAIVWPQLLEAVWMKPWLGWGLRGTSFALSAVLETHWVSEPFTYAHNIILDMAVGMGVPLTLFALVMLATWGWTRIRRVQTPEAWYAVGLLIPFSIHSMLEYPFAYAYFLVPVMFAVGMLERNYAPSQGLKIPKIVFVGNVSVFSALLIWVAVEYVQVEEDFRVARFEALSVGQTAADYERPSIVLLTQLSALVAATRTVPHPSMTPKDLLQLRSTAARFPWVPVQSCYALSAALNGDVPEAQRQLKVIRAMRGARAYEGIKANWTELANTQYPQLQGVVPP
jgi:O-antigen ligase